MCRVDPLARVERLLTGILMVMTPVGLMIMLVPSLARGWLWTTTLYLGVQAVLTLAATMRRIPPARACALFAVIVTLALTLEGVGVRTGWPFGRYSYSTVLSPLLFGIVPPAIGFAWYIVAVNSWILARFSVATLSAQKDAPVSLTITAASMMILGVDILLEPFASFVNRFWTWNHGSVPWQNYAAWLLAGGGFAAASAWFLRARRQKWQAGRDIASPIMVLGMTVLQCVVINVAHGHFGPTLVGLALVCMPLVPAVRRKG